VNHGYTLETEQPHIGGERYLMQAVTTTSGRKLILLGMRRKDGLRVVIKATSDPAGMRELAHERVCRSTLHQLHFAYDTFHSPEELLVMQHGSTYVSIQKYIAQEKAFLERPTEEQFNFALRSLKAQESAHATTHAHLKEIRRAFESYSAARYLSTHASLVANITAALPNATALHETLTQAIKVFTDGRERVAQYCGFLTHTDFVPHNFRIHDTTIYLLDFSSLRFGNKYEGWARFMNFMTLYNPPLEQALLKYVTHNRSQEEVEVLTLMRVYRLTEILWYYTRTLTQTSGNLQELNRARVDLWHTLLTHTMQGTALPETTRQDYIAKRDKLRSEEEKRRQVGLH